MSWVKSAQALQTADKGMEEVVKALAQATVTQQQASAESNRRHEEAMAQQQQALAQAIAAQQENTRLLSAQFMAQQESTQAQVAALQKAVQQLAQGQEQSGVAASNPVSVRASHFLQKLTPSDDVEAFLTTFERIAEREGWPRDQWAGIISPFLTGDPQKAYFDLPAEHIRDYERLKTEILARLGVTTAVRAQRVHRWRYKPDQPPRSQMHELIQLVKKWLQPEKLSGPQMVERVVMDRYLRSLQDDLQRWVSHGNPTNADQLVELVERYTVVEDLLGPAKRREPTPRTPRPATTPRREALPDVGVRRFTPSAIEPRRSVPVPKMGDIQCWRCRSWGHTRAQCPLQEEPMECEVARRSSFYVQRACATHLDLASGRFECEVWVNHLPARALLDSGSMVTLVHARVLGRIGPVYKTLRVVCIHGDTKEYPLVPVTVSYGHTSVTQEVGVVKNLIHDIIVGRDCPLFLELWDQVQTGLPGELGTLSLEGTESGGSGPETSTTHPSNVKIPVGDNDVAEILNSNNSGPMSGLKTELNSEGGKSPHYKSCWGRMTRSSPRLRRVRGKRPQGQCIQTWMYPGVRLAPPSYRILP